MLSEAIVEEMGGSVVVHDPPPPRNVYSELHHVTHSNAALNYSFVQHIPCLHLGRGVTYAAHTLHKRCTYAARTLQLQIHGIYTAHTVHMHGIYYMLS